MDPNNGEIFAMASLPSFDPNIFVQGSKTPEGRKTDRGLLAGRKTAALQPRDPGTLSAGLDVEDSRIGRGAAAGRDHGQEFEHGLRRRYPDRQQIHALHGQPRLAAALVTRSRNSCDGYYYRLALKMRSKASSKMVETFDYDKRSGIDLPNEKISQTPKSWRPIVEKREGRWSDIRTVYSGIGQDTVVVTPISMLRAVSSVGMQRQDVHAAFPEGIQADRRRRDGGPAGIFSGPRRFRLSALRAKADPDDRRTERLVVKGMWGVVNGGGTGAGITIPGFEIAGKTGTAQVAVLGKDVGAKKDHAWFVSFAPAYQARDRRHRPCRERRVRRQFCGPGGQGRLRCIFDKTRRRCSAADA